MAFIGTNPTTNTYVNQYNSKDVLIDGHTVIDKLFHHDHHSPSDEYVPGGVPDPAFTFSPYSNKNQPQHGTPVGHDGYGPYGPKPEYDKQGHRKPLELDVTEWDDKTNATHVVKRYFLTDAQEREYRNGHDVTGKVREQD
jgi:hypothetical protein